MGRNIKFSGQLLVEGNDDQHVILALCKKFMLPENFEVIDCKGIENMFEQIPVRFKQAEIFKIGIIIDADSNLQSRWARLSSLLSNLNFPIPDTIPPEGLIRENPENKRVGVWIMPNNNINGMLEDFITFLIPQEDNLLPIVDTTLLSIEEQNLNQYPIMHNSKAKIHTWLAWQQDPGTPMGLSITKRYLSTDEANCTNLIQWLNSVFN